MNAMRIPSPTPAMIPIYFSASRVDTDLSSLESESVRTDSPDPVASNRVSGESLTAVCFAIAFEPGFMPNVVWRIRPSNSIRSAGRKKITQPMLMRAPRAISIHIELMMSISE